MIATGVFSTILLIGMAGFVQVGKSYYKGLTISQTNESAKAILNSVGSAVRSASLVSGPSSAGSGRQYYCIGGRRYTYNLFNMVDTSKHDTNSNFGLLSDDLAGPNACGNPYDGTAFNNPSEMLGNQMRLLKFDIEPVAGSQNLHSIDITVAYGQDRVLTDPKDPDAQCKLQLGGSQFCAITKLSTIVYEGIQ